MEFSNLWKWQLHLLFSDITINKSAQSAELGKSVWVLQIFVPVWFELEWEINNILI